MVAALAVGQGVVVDRLYGEERAAEFVEQNGFTDLQLTSKKIALIGFRGCDGRDAVGYEFTAQAPNGTIADLRVCKGIFKGATLRQG